MKLKIATLFAVLLIALALAGFSYAWWTETLTINGTVNTGELDAEFTNPLTKSCSEYMTCDVVFIDGGESDPTPIDNSTIIVTVYNGYPSGWCNITFNIHNCGTLPAKVGSIDIVKDPALDVSLEGLSVGTTINPSNTVSPILKIHVNENALEISTYTFNVTIAFVQFNAS